MRMRFLQMRMRFGQMRMSFRARCLRAHTRRVASWRRDFQTINFFYVHVAAAALAAGAPATRTSHGRLEGGERCCLSGFSSRGAGGWCRRSRRSWGTPMTWSAFFKP